MTGPGITVPAKAKERWPTGDYKMAQQQKAAKQAPLEEQAAASGHFTCAASELTLSIG